VAYFYKDFIGGLVKGITQQIKLKLTNEAFAYEVMGLGDVMAQLLNTHVDNPELVDSMTPLFDHKCRLY